MCLLFFYDRQVLLNFRHCQESLMKRTPENASNTPTFLSAIPAYLRRTPVSCQRRNRWWRRGKRGGVLARMKALMRSSERYLQSFWSGFSSVIWSYFSWISDGPGSPVRGGPSSPSVLATEVCRGAQESLPAELGLFYGHGLEFVSSLRSQNFWLWIFQLSSNCRQWLWSRCCIPIFLFMLAAFIRCFSSFQVQLVEINVIPRYFVW